MRKNHKKISFSERKEIFSLLKENWTIRRIASHLGRSSSSISEEVRRSGMNRESYCLAKAQVDRNRKASLKGRHKKLKEGKQPLKIIKKWILKNKWSPEQVSGRLKKEFPKNRQMQVSHETIYKYIYGLKNAEEREMFIRALRRKRKKRGPRRTLNRQRGPIANPVSIHERPKDVDSRGVSGHWEGDSVVGKDHQSAIGTLVERKSRYTIIVPYGNEKTAENVAKAFIEAYKPLPLELKKSLTFDRGAEMAQHQLFTQRTGMPVYFADPGSPGQRGTNENTNGLIREFFPKKTDFSKISNTELKKVEEMLNKRPRKVLGYNTPEEVFNDWSTTLRKAQFV